MSQMMSEGTTSADTNLVPNYGQPVFLAAKQILPLHPHLSEEDDESSEKSSLSPTESEVSSSDYKDVTASESLTAKIMTAPPDILNKDCKVKLDRLTDDEISMWTKTEMIPEFPVFVKGREVGGYTMRMKTLPAKPRHNTRPSRGHSTPNYEDLDTEPEATSPKKPACKHKPVPKDGLSVERLAAHRFYLCSKPKTDSELGDNTTTDPPEIENKPTSQELQRTVSYMKGANTDST